MTVNLYTLYAAISTPIKSGYMLYSNGQEIWRKVFVVLFHDSTIAWFDKPKTRRAIGVVVLQVCHVFFKSTF